MEGHSSQTPKIKPHLQPKHEVNNCHKCNSSFGFFSLKKNCRACGLIFCTTCTDHFIALPEQFDSPSDTPQRVCEDCLLRHSSLDYSRTFEIGSPSGEHNHTIILLAGALGSRQGLQFTFKELSKHFRVITMDLPGLGSRYKEKLSKQTALQAVHDMILDHVPNKKAIICGYSMGGYVAMSFARTHPELCEAIIVGGAMNEWFGASSKLMSGLISFIYKLTPRTKQALFVWNKYSKNCDQNMLKECYLRTEMNYDRWTECAEVMTGLDAQYYADCLAIPNIPKLVLVGEHDFRFSEAQFRAKLSGENSKVVVIPGGSHLVMLEKHEEFHRVIIDWLTQLYHVLDVDSELVVQ